MLEERARAIVERHTTIGSQKVRVDVGEFVFGQENKVETSAQRVGEKRDAEESTRYSESSPRLPRSRPLKPVDFAQRLARLKTRQTSKAILQPENLPLFLPQNRH